jgi:hypothetical protein
MARGARKQTDARVEPRQVAAEAGSYPDSGSIMNPTSNVLRAGSHLGPERQIVPPQGCAQSLVASRCSAVMAVALPARKGRVEEKGGWARIVPRACCIVNPVGRRDSIWDIGVEASTY